MAYVSVSIPLLEIAIQTSDEQSLILYNDWLLSLTLSRTSQLSCLLAMNCAKVEIYPSNTNNTHLASYQQTFHHHLLCLMLACSNSLLVSVTEKENNHSDKLESCPSCLLYQCLYLINKGGINLPL